MKINIAKEFSIAPVARFRSDGDCSGEEFREDWLLPKLKQASKSNPLIVDIDDAAGYPYSFLEEAFGGLVRDKHFTADNLKSILKIEAHSGYTMYRAEIWESIKEAAADLPNNSFDQVKGVS